MLLSIALPKDTSLKCLQEFIKGIHQACKEFGIVLIEGDTWGSRRDLFINLSLTGYDKQRRILSPATQLSQETLYY